MTSNVQTGPLVQKMREQQPDAMPGRTSGNVPLSEPGARAEMRTPTQGDLAAIQMEEGYRNPLPGVPDYLQMRPLYGGVPTA